MKLVSPLMWFLAVMGVAYAAVCGLMYAFQEKLVYAPSRDLGPTPRDIGIPHEAIKVTTADGIALNAWHVPHPDAAFTVIFFHGNAGNIHGRIETVRRFHEMGFEVVIFDYRGFGQSEGVATEDGTYLDASAMWEWVVGDLSRAPQSVVLCGRSLGGAIAIELASRVSARALVIESSFTSLADIGSEAYPWAPVRFLSRIRYASAENIRRALCPVMIVHGTEDPVTPIHHGRRLFEAANQPKIFHEIPGGHDAAVTWDLDAYRDAWMEFLSASRFPYR